MGLCVYIGSLYIRDVGGDRRPAVVSVFGEDRWPSVRRSFGLAGEEVRIFTCLEYGMWDTVFSYCRQWILDPVSIFFHYREIEAP